MKKITGSLHSHGCWTDYKNCSETKNFLFNLETFARFCINQGRDFQAITDIMANRPNGRTGLAERTISFEETRYEDLMATADARANYDFEYGQTESTLYFSDIDKTFTIPRTQEVLTKTALKHVLAVNTKTNIPGELSAEETLKRISGEGGYAIIDHPFMGNAWKEEEILKYHEQGLISAIEWNGGLTLPAFCDFLPIKNPNKRSNNRVLKLQERIPVIANDDSHSPEDIINGATTTYQIGSSSELTISEKIRLAIEKKDFERHESYSAFISPFLHVANGAISQFRYGKNGLPSA